MSENESTSEKVSCLVQTVSLVIYQQTKNTFSGTLRYHHRSLLIIAPESSSQLLAQDGRQL